MTELVEERGHSTALSCRLFGHCRQAWYQSKADIAAELERDSRLLGNVREIREEDPRIGGHKLWLMLCDIYGRDKMMGRDSFLMLLRRHGLMLPAPKARCTTNSNHRFHKWKNLIKGFVPMAANQLWVADITYIAIGNGDVCYLHLITDAYSHKIIGWVLADTLRAAITKEALEQAISQAGEMLIGAYIVCNYARTSLEASADAATSQASPTNWEIDLLLSAKGFQDNNSGLGVNYIGKRLHLEDMHPANVFIDFLSDAPICIDCIIKFVR